MGFFRKNKSDLESNSYLSKSSIQIRSMVITAMLLALYIIFAAIGNLYFKMTFLASFLNLDISLIFLIPLVFICRWQWWMFAAIAGGLANFIWAGVGGYIGAIYNVVLNVITLSFVFLLKFLLFDKQNKKAINEDANNLVNNNQSERLKYWKIVAICIISFAYSILVNCVLNGIIFTPLYMNLYMPKSFVSVSFIEVEKIYNNTNNSDARAMLLYIPNYWTGIFALYSAFNGIKFSIVFLVLIPILIMLDKTNIVNRYFGKNTKLN
ncbi:MAG: hypothetical protein HUJ42_00235 [Malacoplasma sp.]|nr:hypothetical protein [Malacoplasma sp.]